MAMVVPMNYANDFGFDVIEYVKRLRNVGITANILICSATFTMLKLFIH